MTYKGLFTPWEEPLDVFYMFRSNFVSPKKDPMVYIVSHTNPDRWTQPTQSDSIIVYSNCDEVELFNDMDSVSFGKQKRRGIGTHFQWNNVAVQYNVLYAKGYLNGRVVARDTIVLNHLPYAPHSGKLYAARTALPTILRGEQGYKYIYRVNCGGDEAYDRHGNIWQADRPRSADSTWGSVSWTNRFPGLPPFFASQRRTRDAVQGTDNWSLFQTFRYGRQDLQYIFPLRDGDYRVELYFIEPWINWPGGVGERLFDVAVNNTTVLHNLDIYKEAGHNRALKKVVNVHITGGRLVLSFPRVAAGQALISAIAIASRKTTPAAPAPLPLILALSKRCAVHDWLDTGDNPYLFGPASFSALPPQLYGAEWLQTAPVHPWPIQFRLTAPAQVYIGLDTAIHTALAWMDGFTDTKTYIKEKFAEENWFRVWTKRVPAGATISAAKNEMDLNRYIIVATPISNIEPAYDLKTVTNYKAVNASASSGITKETVNGKPALVFKQPAADTLQWTITTGVADIYSLAIRYANPLPQTLTARLQLIDANDHVLNEQTLTFTPSVPGKWNYTNSSTGTTINAGIYRLRLLGPAAGLVIEGLDVQ